jgi:hypothetical protein
MDGWCSDELRRGARRIIRRRICGGSMGGSGLAVRGGGSGAPPPWQRRLKHEGYASPRTLLGRSGHGANH